MRVVLACVLLALGCAPPDPIELPGDTDPVFDEGDPPEIRILYPDGVAPLRLDPDGVLRTLVVIDLLDFDFIEPGGGAEPVDGAGHWHLFVQETEYVGAPSGFHAELESDQFAPGSRGIINVDLRAHDHSPYKDIDPDCRCEARIEFDVLASD